MPKMLATALWPMAALQIVAMNNPIEVAARMIGREAPTAVAGTTPTRTRPRATDPTMNTGRPSMDGSPASGASTGTGSPAISVSVTGADPELLADASRSVIGCSFAGNARGRQFTRAIAQCVPLRGTRVVLTLSQPRPGCRGFCPRGVSVPRVTVLPGRTGSALLRPYRGVGTKSRSGYFWGYEELSRQPWRAGDPGRQEPSGPG